MHQLTSPEHLFAQVLSTQASRPFVSFHDDATGEWAELSARSSANWIAKTHFLLMDGLGLGVGDRAYIALPAHWISAPILLGCWSAGLSVTDDPAEAAVAFTAPDSLARTAGILDVFAINPAAVARGFAGEPPATAQDYVAAVRPQPDAWASVAFAAGPDDPAVNDLGRAEVVAAAQARAEQLGLVVGGRLLSVRPWQQAGDWVDSLVVALAVGGSLVLVANAEDDRIERHASQERATATLR